MQDRELSLLGHLDELRKRIIYSFIPFLAAIIVCSFFIKPVLLFLRLPAQGVIEKLAFFSPQEVAIAYVKIAIFGGLVISLPVILYQVWKFVSPALEQKQRRYIFSFVFFASLAFLAGSLFAYLYLLPISLKFLIGLGGNELIPVISLSKYLSFVLALILGCGLVFEMPVLAWLLSKIGIVNSRFLRRKRKYAVVLMFILAAIVTPTSDPFNMCLLAFPMLVLYEISIWISQWQQR